jgi:uncharacterized membrane-anchored protein YhcB (DUF1043 family)
LADTKDWITSLVSLITGLAGSAVIQKIIEARQAARKAKTDAPMEDKKLDLESRKARIEERKAEDAADAELIKLLMQDKATDRARIEKLEDDRDKERARCDEEMNKLRQHFEVQMANAQQAYNAQIEALRAEIRALITEVATVKSENAQLKKDLDTFR